MKTTTLVSCLTGGLLVAACSSEAPSVEPPEPSDPEGDAVVIATAEAVATAAAAAVSTNGAGGTTSAPTGGTTPSSATTAKGAASSGTGGSPAEASSSTESGGSAGATPSGQGGAGGSRDVGAEASSTSTSSGGAGEAGQPVTTGEPLPPPPIPVGAVLITEYVEGPSNDKAVELSNLSSKAVSLAACRLEIYFNDNPEPGPPIALAAELAPGTSLVLCHTSASAELLAVCDQTGGISFNGNDTVVLRCEDAVHDSFGQVGFEGSEWRNTAPSSGAPPTGPFSSIDHVLRRRCDVAPRTEPAEPFEVALTEDWFPVWSFEVTPGSAGAYDGLGDPACDAPDPGAGGAAGLE